MWNAARKTYKHLPFTVQKALVDWYGRYIRRDRFGPEYEELSAFLERSERSDPEELRAYQESRLREIVRHAYETVPHYRDVMDERNLKPTDITGIEDLAKLPVLRKDDVRDAGDRLRSSAVRRTGLARAGTSATSGTPLQVYRDRPVSLMNHACYMRFRRWAGFPFGMPYATMQGRLVVPPQQRKPPFWRYNRSWNQIMFSTVHMSEGNLPLYVEKLREFGTQALESFPSCAYVLARYLENRDEYLPLSAVTTTGEPLLPPERDVIEDRFQTKVFDAYSTAERVVFSSECEQHEGHHLFSEYGVTEVVGDDGSPLSPGSTGLLVGTSLHNLGSPMIRYACGDVGALSERTCSCGRTLPMLDGLMSRIGDYVVTPDGRMIPSIMVSWSIKSISAVRQWRLTQESVDDIRMEIVKDEPIEQKELQSMMDYFSRRLGPDVRVHVERVPDIPRTAGGKVRHVISHVPLVWGDAPRSSGGSRSGPDAGSESGPDAEA
jgi:phenylacetate-CoA ligase